MGRPTTFTDELFDQICDRLANGEVLKQICADPDMPDRSTVLRRRNYAIRVRAGG